MHGSFLFEDPKNLQEHTHRSRLALQPLAEGSSQAGDSKHRALYLPARALCAGAMCQWPCVLCVLQVHVLGAAPLPLIGKRVVGWSVVAPEAGPPPQPRWDDAHVSVSIRSSHLFYKLFSKYLWCHGQLRRL